MRLTDERIAELRRMCDASTGWLFPPIRREVVRALVDEIAASRAARAESEGTRLDGTARVRCDACGGANDEEPPGLVCGYCAIGTVNPTAPPTKDEGNDAGPWCGGVGPADAVCDLDSGHAGSHRGWSTEGRIDWTPAPASRDGQARKLPVRTARRLSGDDLRDAARRLSPQPAMEDYEDASRDGQGETPAGGDREGTR